MAMLCELCWYRVGGEGEKRGAKADGREQKRKGKRASEREREREREREGVVYARGRREMLVDSVLTSAFVCSRHRHEELCRSELRRRFPVMSAVPTL